MEKDIELMKQCLETKSPILLLGAGFSLGAKGRTKEKLLLGGTLCERLYEHVILPHKLSLTSDALDDAEYACKKGKLKDLCTVIRDNNLVKERNSLLNDYFSNCTFDDASYYSYLTDYNWSYIFTLNIDDLVERIYSQQDRPLICWNLSSNRYSESPHKTVLVKLHGDVGSPDTYVFDDKEYQKFTNSDCWMLRKFSDLYVCNDVIIVGTQFQEKDLEIALEKVFSYRCDNSNYHYFFVSPGAIRSPIKDLISSHPNFHHIQWDTETFLNFVNTDISAPRDALHMLNSQGISFWNHEIDYAKSCKEDWALYHGRLSEPKDFYYSVDIPRINAQNDISEFLNQNDYGYIEIVGKPYVGKTCLAKRALTIGVGKGFKSLYCANSDLHVLSSINQYLSTLGNEDSVLICLENSASLYRPIAKLVDEYRFNLKKIIVITTSNDTTRESDNYVFGSAPVCEFIVQEQIDSVLGNSIYNKLHEKSQLGKLLSYADSKSGIVKYIRSINDLIDVLYVAHHGIRFSEYFSNWLKTKEADDQLSVFQAITLLSSMGISSIMISKLPEISASVGCYTFNYPTLISSFGEFCSEDNGFFCLRCSRLFSDVVLEALPLSKKEQFIKDLAYMISRNLKENDRTFDNELFKHITRASSLKKVVGMRDADALAILLELRESCKHLSYYWIQVGILYRNTKAFEDAENSFEYAKNAHGAANYQIAHAMAKNYMEWGLWALTNAPTQATHLFEEGASQMLELLWLWQYPDAICFSAHTYIDMSIKYYTHIGVSPTADTWRAMIICMEKFIHNTSKIDRLLKSTFESMRRFASERHLPFEKEQEFSQALQLKSASFSANHDCYDIDILPVYDS